MKQLVIVRHAKSSWRDIDHIQDMDRPLKVRGVKDAYTMASRMKAKGWSADYILSSPANRALHTAAIFSSTFNHTSHSVSILNSLYHPSVEKIENSLNDVPDEVNTLYLFSHNPAITFFGEKWISNFHDHVPTCGLLAFQLDIDKWNEADASLSQFCFFDYPKSGIKKES